MGLSPSSVSKYIKSGLLWNNFYFFRLKVEDKKSFVFSLHNEYIINNEIYKNLSKKKQSSSMYIDILENEKVIYKFNSLRTASKFLNISKSYLVKYWKNGKLWNDRYIFKVYK